MAAPIRLREQYKSDVIPFLMKELNYSNVMQVPRLEKIVVNIGDGELHSNQKQLDSYVNELKLITGRKPIINLAKKSVSNFKIRQGMAVGLSVTLRGEVMWEFLDRLISIVLPRVRDFRGLSNKAFDGRGNYTLGVKEQVIFPEIVYDNVEKVHGMDISFVTSAHSDKESSLLLKELGMPFMKKITATDKGE